MEAACSAAIEKDQEHANVYCNPGVLLYKERQDIGGAEAACRVAIATDQDHDNAHCNLGILLDFK